MKMKTRLLTKFLDKNETILNIIINNKNNTEVLLIGLNIGNKILIKERSLLIKMMKTKHK